jgi:hypothetical protein
MSTARTAGARLALDRNEELIRFQISASVCILVSQSPSPHDGVPGGRRGAPGGAYLVSTEEDGRWMIEEAGDRDSGGRSACAMLQVMLARYPSERLPEIKCWWPRALIPPQVKVAATTPTQSVLMIRPLRDRILPLPPLAAAEVVYWHSVLL